MYFDMFRHKRHNESETINEFQNRKEHCYGSMNSLNHNLNWHDIALFAIHIVVGLLFLFCLKCVGIGI